MEVAHRGRVAAYDAEGAVEAAHAVVRRPGSGVHLHVPPPEQRPRQAPAPARTNKAALLPSVSCRLPRHSASRPAVREALGHVLAWLPSDYFGASNYAMKAAQSAAHRAGPQCGWSLQAESAAVGLATSLGRPSRCTKEKLPERTKWCVKVRESSENTGNLKTYISKSD